MHPPSIQKLIGVFSKFPTVGQRTASRFVFYLLKLPEKEIEELIEAVKNLKKEIKLCDFCFNPFQTENSLCPICSNVSRDSSLLCVVADEADLLAIEKTRKYRGLYFILGGVISNLKKKDIDKLRAEELKKRVQNPSEFLRRKSEFREIILALNPTTEGEAIILYLERILKPFNIKTSRLGRGLPLGGELEYADEETLEAAFEGRK